MTRLSVCVQSSGRHPRRLLRILSLLRETAEEIVVALDDRRADSADLVAAGADRVLLFPHRDPGDRTIAWLFGECAGDWLLNLDDDEIPSCALLAELPRLIARRDVTHAWIARRWLYPAASTYIDEPPWSTEFQLRLFLHDSRCLSFSDEFHRPVVCDGPMRFVAAPLWHLDTAVNDRACRLDKARAYEQARRGMRVGAFSHNTGLYVPELLEPLRLSNLDPGDRVLVERVLGDGAPAMNVHGIVSRATRDEIDAAWPGEPFHRSLYRAEVSPLAGSRATLVAGVRQTLDVVVRNRSEVTWPATGAITIGTRWNRTSEGVRTELPAAIGPHDSAVVPVHLDPPAGAADAELEIDLVHEHVRWFGCPALIAVAVQPRRRVAVIGGARGTGEILDALLEAPQIEPVVLEWDDPVRGRDGYPAVGGLGSQLFAPGGRARVRAVARALRLALVPRSLVSLLGDVEAIVIPADAARPTAPPRREALYLLTLSVTARRARIRTLRVRTSVCRRPYPRGALTPDGVVELLVGRSSEVWSDAQPPPVEPAPADPSVVVAASPPRR